MSFLQRIFGRTPTPPIKQIIGRGGPSLWDALRTPRPATDRTRPDYAFWDALRRGEARGYELAGLFCAPVTQILAGGVLAGELDATPAAAPAPYTAGRLKAFLSEQHATLVTLVEDLYALGDQYVIVGADGALRVPPPDAVQAEYAPHDYRTLTRVTVTTILDDRTITDTYTAAERVVRVKLHGSAPDPTPVRYPNLLGVLPVVHFANDRGTNETHGRPAYAPLRRLLARYNTLLEKALDGAELMGNPVPALTGMEDIEEVLAYNETDITEATDDHGHPVQRVRLAFDRMMMVILGKGGRFSFVSPSVGFTQDVRDMLQLLFLLVLEHTRIPEAVWGGELSAARASAEQQMLPFYQHIERHRTLLSGPLGQVLALWVQAQALTDDRITPGPVQVRWGSAHTGADQLRYQWTTWLHSQGLISDDDARRAAGW